MKQHFRVPLDGLSTIGFDFLKKTVEIGNKSIHVLVWDYSPRSDFMSVSHTFIRGADGVFLMYDVTDENSFHNIDKWYAELERHADFFPQVVIIANKTDLNDERKVSTEEGMTLASRLKCKYFEMSAIQDTENVDRVFDYMIEEITSERAKRNRL
eukprot:TRINITY_DN12217_c0_g1_i1.p1 TRINITY_DN12217_c0_g1~~TRINITY_DN12217_c0_g1_i1.p1  ORF type:complete len:155 (+),score=26.74 TRINITY_DN12217_c0_g1_i1:169-633(+)